MTPIDPHGTVVVELRENAELMSVLSALGGDENHITGGEARRPTPNIVVASLGGVPWPPNARRLTPLREERYAVHCTASKGPNGDIEASRLARYVAAAFHGRGWRTRVLGSGEHVSIALSMEEATGPAHNAPDSGDPMVTVLATFKAVAQAT